ncbi:MAG: hypothetical protein E4H08_03715 [Candidatus Atribacteria bacterium]|nr:MAG: hypothetical protein E4H08_03715 [Candidatus Atribacteria bacterium]
MGGGWHTLAAAGGSRRRGSAQRSRRLWLFIACIAALCALLSLFTYRGFRIQGLRRALAAADFGYTEAMITRQDLEYHLALKDDLSAIEDAAREQLGWVLPGEERVVFVDPVGERGGE